MMHTRNHANYQAQCSVSQGESAVILRTTIFVAVAMTLFLTTAPEMATQGFEPEKQKAINIVKIDELKGDPPENQDTVQQNLVNYKEKLLQLRQSIQAKQVELDGLRLQTKNTDDDIANLKSQEMDTMIDRRQLFIHLSDN